MDQFGNPLASTSYALCVYDDAMPLKAYVIQPGGTCGTRGCWRDLHGIGFAYKDKSSGPEGIREIILRVGNGRGIIRINGTGANLAPPLPIAQNTQVTVQFIKNPGSGSECWEAVFANPARENEPETFRDLFP